MRLVPGDELRLRYSGDAAHPAWQSVGHVVWTFSLVLLIFLRGKIFYGVWLTTNTLTSRDKLVGKKKLLRL